MSRITKKGGFTLIEIIVALSVFSMFSLVTLKIYANVVSFRVRSANYLKAQILLVKQKELIDQNEKEFLLTETKEDVFQEPYDQFSWRTEVRECDIDFVSMLLEDSQVQAYSSIIAPYIQTFEETLKKAIKELKLSVIWYEDGRETKISTICYYLGGL